ncbi:hypothetical protein O9K51_07755 [Purpureocillium lavendulum]|uniref:Ankyrin repeat protein n=1 Tax=Purpureocillium lavendulum TaxID=1247861 RepID=A0AB34FM96_9HYPO|nr:hypothetical protein O9K51_07755 [Purpureocillium lavendulum]
MDPLSISAGVAGFISLGLEVTKSLVEFYRAYKDQDADIAHTISELDRLCVALETLNGGLKSRNFSPGEPDLVSAVEGAIGECIDHIEELQYQVEKFTKHHSGSIWAKVAAGPRRLAYPFKKTTLEKLKGDVSELRSSVGFALQVLQRRDIEETRDELREVRDILDLVQSVAVDSAIRSWLKAPDPTELYNDACKKRQPGTGLWLVRGETFYSWLATQGSFLWINGFAGTGKSLLCCTAIQHAFRHRRSNPRIGLAFYFFSFADASKQTVSGMLRSLILQLSSQQGECPLLKQLYDTYCTATPPMHSLLGCLEKLVLSFDDVYIFLDALDECPHDAYQPRDSQRDELLETIRLLRGWDDTGLHLLVTSRDEWEIREALCPSPTEVVSMQNDFVNGDIAKYIDTQLQERRRLQKWSKSHRLIKEKLTQRADGVFRWVDCQFGALESCLTLAQLKETLSTLPSTLSETYERVLASIPEQHAGHARRILHILCCTAEAPTVRELIYLAAVEIGEDDAKYDPEDQVHSELIRSICPGFLEVGEYSVQFAHASVQEYLESRDVGRWNKSVERFRFDKNKGHAMMACIYLAHVLFDPPTSEEEEEEGNGEVSDEEAEQPVGAELIEPRLDEHSEQVAVVDWGLPWNSDQKTESDTDEAARETMLHYAVWAWIRHYRSIVDATEQQLPAHLIMRLFRNQADFSRYEKYLYSHPQEHPPQCWHGVQVYTAASLGLDFIVASLLDNTSWWEGPQPIRHADLLNQEWRTDTLLHVAARNGHAATVRILLDRGVAADIGRGRVDLSLVSGSTCPWFREASKTVEDEMVGTALQEAAWGGHGDVAALLLDRGADVNFQGGYGRATVGYVGSQSANVNHQGGMEATALQVAAHQRHEAVVKLLLSRGADVNIQGGLSGTALQAAASAFPPSEAIVRLLLDHGADVNAVGGVYGTALQAAALRGDEYVVRLLLSRGADVNIQHDGGLYGTALHAAAYKGEARIVRLLLDRGADVNAQCGMYRTALIAGAARNAAEVVNMLLEHGADASVRTDKFGTAFEVVYQHGLRLDVLDVLFRHGLVPDAKAAAVRRVLRKRVWPRLPGPYVVVEDTELPIGLASLVLDGVEKDDV